MHKRITPLIVLLLLLFALNIANAGNLLAETKGFLRYPDIHGEKVVFSSSGDLWLSSLDGGTAIRITSHEGKEMFPKFSPDGKWIAFTGQYYGNSDVYVVSTEGGIPKQLTYNGTRDYVIGWDEDGHIVFRSDREPPFRADELYTVSIEGGFPAKMPMARASRVTFEPNGDRIAFTIYELDFHVWNNYKGGEAEKIWVGDPSIPQFDLVSHYLGNESFPMWHEDGRLFFVMDSLGRENLWSMNPDGSLLEQETTFEDYDVRWPSMRGGNIIFQHGMDLSVYDINSKDVTQLDITVPTDMYVARTKFVDGPDYVRGWDLNADGSRLIVESRGEIFTLPVKGDGYIRQWTFSSDSRQKIPSFIHDSDDILFVTDESGEDRFVKINEAGEVGVEVEKNPLNDWKDSFHLSPDGKWMAYASGKQILYLVNMENGKRKEIDKGGWEFDEYVWSPDSRYLAFVRVTGEAGSTKLYIYDTKDGKTHLACNPNFNTWAPAWDPDGKYLYCVTEREFGPYQDYGRGLFFYDRTGTLALLRLREDVPSPFIERGDEGGSGVPEAAWIPKEEEKEDDKKDDEEEEGPEPIVIEFDGLIDRMVPLDEISGNYGGLEAVSNKVYFYEWQSRGMGGNTVRDYGGTSLRVYDLAEKSSSEVTTPVSNYMLSSDGSTIVVRKRGSWYWMDAGSTSLSTDGEHTVSTSGWTFEVNPSEEWGQIVKEAWRQQREFFYEPALHEVDWDGVYERFAPFIDRLTTREDVQDLIREIQAELNIGHAYIGAGEEPEPKTAPLGHLGVDLMPDTKSGYYKITKVFNPEPGTEGGASPLAYADPATGKGTYILAVNGRKVKADQHIGKLLQNQAGKTITLLLNEKPEKEGAREVVIKALRSERSLRYLDWAKEKREYVFEKSDGKIGYVYLPDMSTSGASEFGRNYYSQKHMPAMILDDRFNAGGNISEYIMKEMTSPIFAQQASRYGGHETKPHGSFHGYVGVLINGSTASDGETMAYNTRLIDTWTSVGTRTWGGWVWIWPRRPLLDNATVVVPEFGGWGNDGNWIIEGPGVEPEVEVINDPASEMMGKDPQLDAAILLLLKQMKENPRVLPPQPSKGPFSK